MGRTSSFSRHVPLTTIAALMLATSAASAAAANVDFATEVLPILARRCAICHSDERQEGDFNLSTREGVLQGGYSGQAAIVGNGRESLLIQMIEGADGVSLMPAKGPQLTERQIEVLRNWIDQGLSWPEGLRLTPAMGVASLELHKPQLPESLAAARDNPIDVLLASYFASQGVVPGEIVSDRAFARRAYLDLIGLLPTPEQLAAFEQNDNPNKRAQLVDQLLSDRTNYALHWMTFWNDALRNSYRGTGFIDNNRTQITAWLFAALYDNRPYDEFVRELIAPSDDSKGFVRGIVWRGVVNASQRQELQAAQSISQVFLGINLKCASCHDSFVDPWKLSDAYSLAAVFAEDPLVVNECDKPIDQTASPAFLFPKLGTISATATPAERQRVLAALITSEDNGRFGRTVVNRLWQRFFGRGIVDNVDNMDEEPFDAKLLDWLAADFVEHGYDLHHTMRLICNSRAYQTVATAPHVPPAPPGPFRGPVARRLNAEQFVDAVSQVTGIWQTETKEITKIDFRGQGGQLTAIREVLEHRRHADDSALFVRASLVDADALQGALGRPNREQVVTRRDSVATPLEALEFTNGEVLDRILHDGAVRLVDDAANESMIVESVYAAALGRVPNREEAEIAVQLIGSPATIEGTQDLLWTVFMLPEFQFID